jgi:hypothetical protein
MINILAIRNKIIKKSRVAPTLISHLVPTKIGRNQINPVLELTFGLIAACAPQNPDKRLLCQIFGAVVVTDAPMDIVDY